MPSMAADIAGGVWPAGPVGGGEMRWLLSVFLVIDVAVAAYCVFALIHSLISLVLRAIRHVLPHH